MLVRVEMIKGKSAKYKKAVLNAIHYAMEDVLEITEDERFQRIVEIPEEDFEMSSEKTNGFMIIEITLFPGRPKELKKALIKKITSNLAESLSLDADDIYIIFHEPPLENWGMAGEQLG